MMNSYRKIKKEIMLGLENGYYVTVEFMSKTVPLKIVIGRHTPLEHILDRVKFIVKLYENVLNEKTGKIVVDFDCRSLETHIFVEVKDG